MEPSTRVADFACGTCGSVAVVYPDELSDDAPVRCQRCQTILCTLAEFRLVAGRKLARFESSVARRSYAFFMSSPRFISRRYQSLARLFGADSSNQASNAVTGLRAATDTPD